MSLLSATFVTCHVRVYFKNNMFLHIPIYITTAIFIAEMNYKSLIFAAFKPKIEKIANTIVSAILNSNGANNGIRTRE